MRTAFVSHALTASIVINLVMAIILHNVMKGAVTVEPASTGIMGIF